MHVKQIDAFDVYTNATKKILSMGSEFYENRHSLRKGIMRTFHIAGSFRVKFPTR